ncbi:hypothetical protein POG22_12850 [Geitlerinema sp. CS-897]|nr:hypothetical protein [Geitlerinema sp. CS-897]
MGKRSIALSASVLLLTGCSAAMVPDLEDMAGEPASSAEVSPETQVASTTPPPTPTPEPLTTGNAALDGWEFRVTDAISSGKSYRGQSAVYKAEDSWTVVSVGIKNTHSDPQEAQDAPFLLFLAKVVDSEGNEYGVSEIDYKYDLEFSRKSFASGEVRSMDLLFNTPSGVRVTQLVVETTDFRQPVRIGF